MGILTAEDAVLARLKTAAAGTKLRVDSLPGDWDQDMLRTFRQVAPALLVAISGGSAERGAFRPVCTCELEVYVATSHPSGEAARRRGTAAGGAGAYELIERLVVPALHNFTIPDVGTLELLRFENLYTGQVEQQGLSIYGVVFALPIPFDVDAAAAELPDFATFYAQYDVPAFETEAQHRAWLAGNYTASNPDARDQVALPPIV